MLNLYANASCQQVNLEKIELLSSRNVDEEVVNDSKALWNVHTIQHHT